MTATGQWKPFLKEGETPFERFTRERKDLDALLELYKKAIAAPQREWVGLTDEEKREFWESQWHVGTAMDFMDTYEAALKEKNNG